MCAQEPFSTFRRRRRCKGKTFNEQGGRPVIAFWSNSLHLRQRPFTQTGGLTKITSCYDEKQ
ncbi:hypothetical protein SAMN05444359_12224 [Neolewinella agarilytica]|uniref:Uncharacterized protein n=1 Tax=Neolewinella agarilytica TaxID=478744 RepID=A0A1H9KXB0_9BACT|nr:hypothetical protein SAMN05444359_12224 [Neolewinella agarilytica]